MRVADFFCGGGGFSEGFRQAGFDIVFAVDKWEPAVATYRGNKPGTAVIQDDIMRIAALNDAEFENLVPDTEVIIGSPPCQAFSQSNKSGNGDKTLGIELINAFLRIIARKKYKKNSTLKYWILENVPNVQQYIKKCYTSEELGLKGNFHLSTIGKASGIYNAKYFGAPTNRKRYLCGDFPQPIPICDEENVVKLQDVLCALREPLSNEKGFITDVNYPTLQLPKDEVSDHQYIFELAPFEWNTAKRLKQDKGYMGRMAFPEDLSRPARTVMATMSANSRESMILGFGNNQYRLPTVREVATMMSFPIDYKFYGASKGIKNTLVGNAVPPKMAYAIAKAIALDGNQLIPFSYIPICHTPDIKFFDLNGAHFPLKTEKTKRDTAKFKYHIPYLIISSYRVELTNYHSDFEQKMFKWNVEIHYSQGKKKAAIYCPSLILQDLPAKDKTFVKKSVDYICKKAVSFKEFQDLFCMTSLERKAKKRNGPYELLDYVKGIISDKFSGEQQTEMIIISETPGQIPRAIAIGFCILDQTIKVMGELSNGCYHKERKAQRANEK